MASDFKAPALVFTADPAQVEQITRELEGVRNGVPRALRGAINKTIPKGQTTLVNGLVARLAAKRGNILGKKDNRRITTVRATDTKLSGTIKIMSRPIGLINFKVKDTRGRKKGWNRKGSGQGVTAQIYRDEAPVRLPKAFIAVGLSNNKHVFERFGGKRRQAKAHHIPNIGRMRQPIRSYKGISLHTVWKESPRLRKDVQNRLATEFPKEISSQVNFLLKRKKPATAP